jgi:hypothetical protein
MLIGFLVVAATLGGLAAGVRLYMSRAAEDALGADERVVIAELRDPIPGNAFLACPAGYCRAAAMPSPVVAVPADRLADLWAEVIAGESHVVRVEDEPAKHRVVLIQHTPLLRFPDIVTIEFVALGPARSSLAIYSRARYGSGDFGKNRRRVLSWLKRIVEIAGQ